MKSATLSGVVLAAGLSRRMGTLKPVLSLDGTPAVLHAVRTFTDIGVAPVVVVGHAAGQVSEALSGSEVRVVVNHQYRSGMWSSVVCGLRAVRGCSDWVAVLPADCALVRAETVGALLRRAGQGDLLVVHPTHHGSRGHPPLISACLLEAAFEGSPRDGLRELLASQDKSRVSELPVDDPGVLLDMDRPEQYARMEQLADLERIPDDQECERLQTDFGMPSPVRAHCAAVADVADLLSLALQCAGVLLHRRLLRSAALLHDIARARKDHAATGARQLSEAGYPRLAPLVAVHMEPSSPPDGVPGEAAVLYLADKLVQGERVTPLRRRLAEVEARFRDDEAASDAARRRLFHAVTLAETVGRLTGLPVDELIDSPAAGALGREIAATAAARTPRAAGGRHA